MGISSMFKKFMFARGLNIDKGKVQIFGLRLIILSLSTVAGLQSYVIKKFNKEGVIAVYKAGKLGGYELASSMRKTIKEKDNFKLVKYVLEGNAELVGWGIFDLVKYDNNRKIALFHLKDSPFPEYFRRTGKCICHLTRGLTAGFMSNIFNVDVDCVETKCISKGNVVCELIVKPKKDFDVNSRLAREQLPIDEISKLKK